MDFIKKAVSGGSNENKGEQSTASGSAAGGEQKQDYGDKAFDFISKKTGHDFDPKTDEKITDGGRSAYEKFSG